MRGKIIENVTLLTKMILRDVVKEGYKCIDATVGNGHDTLTLSDIVGDQGHIYGFDVQEQALEMTKEKLEGRKNYSLFLMGHEHMKSVIEGPIDFIIFNLGYLPKADKSITTKKTTTLQAIESSLDLLKCHGVLWIAIYPGHDAGKEEADAIEDYVSDLEQKSYSVVKMSFMNQRNNPPYIIGVEKKVN